MLNICILCIFYSFHFECKPTFYVIATGIITIKQWFFSHIYIKFAFSVPLFRSTVVPAISFLTRFVFFMKLCTLLSRQLATSLFLCKLWSLFSRFHICERLVEVIMGVLTTVLMAVMIFVFVFPLNYEGCIIIKNRTSNVILSIGRAVMRLIFSLIFGFGCSP